MLERKRFRKMGEDKGLLFFVELPWLNCCSGRKKNVVNVDEGME